MFWRSFLDGEHRVKTFTILALLLPSLFLLCLVVLFYWGENQLLTPRYIENKLRKGMNVEEALFQLALQQADCYTQKTTEKYECKISKKGVGSIFYPQHTVILHFVEQKSLHSYSAYWSMLLDEKVEEGEFYAPVHSATHLE